LPKVQPFWITCYASDWKVEYSYKGKSKYGWKIGEFTGQEQGVYMKLVAKQVRNVRSYDLNLLQCLSVFDPKEEQLQPRMGFMNSGVMGRWSVLFTSRVSL
jgi:hypothetical protein